MHQVWGMLKMTAETDNQFVADLVASRKPGYSLPGQFYSDERIYRAIGKAEKELTCS